MKGLVSRLSSSLVCVGERRERAGLRGRRLQLVGHVGQELDALPVYRKSSEGTTLGSRMCVCLELCRALLSIRKKLVSRRVLVSRTTQRNF